MSYDNPMGRHIRDELTAMDWRNIEYNKKIDRIPELTWASSRPIPEPDCCANCKNGYQCMRGGYMRSHLDLGFEPIDGVVGGNFFIGDNISMSHKKKMAAQALLDAIQKSDLLKQYGGRMSAGGMSAGGMSGGNILSDILGTVQTVASVAPLFGLGESGGKKKKGRGTSGGKMKKGMGMSGGNYDNVGMGMSGGDRMLSMSGGALESTIDASVPIFQGMGQSGGSKKKKGAGIISDIIGAIGLGKKKKEKKGAGMSGGGESGGGMSAGGVSGGVASYEKVARKMGGHQLLLKQQQPPSMMSGFGGAGKAKKEPNAWIKLTQKIRKEQGLSLKDAIAYIKKNNLYKK